MERYFIGTLINVKTCKFPFHSYTVSDANVVAK